MTSIIIYSLYVMPCVHLHRREHWTFHLVLYEFWLQSFQEKGRPLSLANCDWLWNELENAFCFLFGGDAFSFKEESVYLEQFISGSKIFNIFIWLETVTSQVVTCICISTDVQHWTEKAAKPFLPLAENMEFVKHMRRKLVASIFIMSVKNSIKTWKTCLKVQYAWNNCTSFKVQDQRGQGSPPARLFTALLWIWIPNSVRP